MKKKWIAFLSAVILAACVSPVSAVSANSAQTYWSGTTASGAAVLEENCPIIVESEELVFDLCDFPSNYYESGEEFLSYGGKVTARYRFYNPADYTVNATLVFPFGEYPDYGIWYDWETEKYFYDMDNGRYGVTVDGVEIPTKLRYTEFSYPFDAAEDLAKLRDSYIDDGFFAYDRPVTKKTYKISGMDAAYHSAYTSIKFYADESKTRVMLNPCHGSTVESDGIRVGTWAKNGEVLTLYVIGEPLQNEPVWTIYENGGEKQKIGGSVDLISEDTMMFEDLVFTDYDADSGISKVDWYNAFVDRAYRNTYSFGFTSYSIFMPYQLMRWYEYEIELAPHTALINEVTAPMYPGINGNYDLSVFEYRYLLSPAGTWASFGTLDVEIITPYYVIECNQSGLERGENGYTAAYSSLPEGELTFSLCATESPERLYNSNGCAYIAVFFIIYVGLALAVFVPIVVIVIVAVHWARKNQKVK